MTCLKRCAFRLKWHETKSVLCSLRHVLVKLQPWIFPKRDVFCAKSRKRTLNDETISSFQPVWHKPQFNLPWNLITADIKSCKSRTILLNVANGESYPASTNLPNLVRDHFKAKRQMVSRSMGSCERRLHCLVVSFHEITVCPVTKCKRLKVSLAVVKLFMGLMTCFLQRSLRAQNLPAIYGWENRRSSWVAMATVCNEAVATQGFMNEYCSHLHLTFCWLSISLYILIIHLLNIL